MNPNDPNVMLLELVADRLGEELRSEFAFVGGENTWLRQSLVSARA